MTTPIRIQLRRTKGWRMPENTVNVARPGKWGNPFTIAAALESGIWKPRSLVVAAFKDWLDGYPWACGSDTYEKRRAAILDGLHLLHGKNLACWCALDQPCHADVLLELANKPEGEA